jgi:N-acetylneuraminic acid mutarotase
MKKYIPFLILFISYSTLAQVGISATNITPNTSAMLDVSSTTKGILIPRMNTLQKNAIPNKAEGLMVYDTDSKLFSYWIVAAGTGGYWMDFPQTVSTSPNYWTLNNSDISNNNAGNVGIGITNPTQKIEVAGKIKIGNDSQAATEGTIRYNATNKYFEGFDGTNWVAFNANNSASLPQSAIVLSETKTNTNLTNAGYSLNGVTNFQFNQYSSDAYGWLKQLNSINAPTARDSHSAVWTGTSMIIFGGIVNNATVNDGKSYNPSTNSWTPISSASGLSARANTNAVWTGTKMIIWGGGYNDGALYDPTLDQWSIMSTTNAPAARGFSTAVWTGTKMIIWGGQLSNGVFSNDGKIYDPSSNTWASISSLNAPAGRFHHTAIWTGSKMIVFGGGYITNNFVAYKTGSIYDPTADTWTTITPAPSELFAHTAVWTGTKMVVFGGLDVANSLTNVCYLYDPITNAWTTANATNAPAPRKFHTSIWTGTKMLVFGGFTTAVSQDGGVFDPTTNTWSSDHINLSGYDYSGHTAVWTGEDMLIFGLSPGHLLKKDFKSPAAKSMYLFQKN